MKLNGKNIILDDDVTLTGEYLGKKLSDVLGGLQSRTSKLERYLKWIYKYGGVGGVGGGGGGGSSSSYTVLAKINGVDISSGNLVLGTTGIYSFEVKINRPEGASFKVDYRYDTEMNGKVQTIQKSVVLDVSNNYTFSTKIDFNTNGSMVVTAVDSVYAEEKQVSGKYITKSYTLATKLVNDLGQDQLGEIYTDVAGSNGINVRLDYDVSVPAVVEYKVIFNKLSKTITKEGRLDTDGKFIVFNLRNEKMDAEADPEDTTAGWWGIQDSDSGYYSGQVEISITLTDSGRKLDKEIYPFNFTLVPQNLYLLVQPQIGNMYNSIPEEGTEVYEYTPGYITFNIRPYYGTKTGTACNVYYYVENSEGSRISQGTTKLNLKELSTVRIYLTKPGWSKIHFMLENSGIYYPGGSSSTDYVVYNFKVKENNTSLKWPNEERLGGSKYNYYRGDHWTDAFQGFADLAHGEPFQQTSNKESIVITGFNKPESASSKFNTSIAIGLMYSNINSEGTVIMTGYQTSGGGNTQTELIRVTQNEVVIGNTTRIPYYLPKTQNNAESEFHLLNIVSRLVTNNGTSSTYEVIVYVDGRIEGACSSYVNTILVLDKLVINPSNCWINMLELSYPETIYRTETNGTKTSVPEDLEAYKYYLKYQSSNSKDISEDDVNLITYYNQMTVENNGDVSCSFETVANIAKGVNLPTLVLTVDDSKRDQKDYLEASYSENDDRVKDIPVDVHWCPGKGKGEGLNQVTLDGSSRFIAKIQGSSTRTFKCKNYTLSLKNTNEDILADKYLFSPNFSESNKASFLPEESFTLKADVVDSSHSNNTSIGKFINRITTPFETNTKSGPLSGHIKNCLDGFPVLVYIQFSRKNQTTEASEDICYYQGVYNFNLGRESYYNLGYKDCSVFYDETGTKCAIKDAGNSFLITKIPSSKDSFKSGIVVAEVQGNSPYFDFSQWHESILFKQYSLNNETYMFGDIVTGNGINESQAKQVLQALVKKIAMAGGYIFGESFLKKRFSTSPEDHYGYDQGYNAEGELVVDAEGSVKKLPLNQVPNYRYQLKKVLSSDSTDQKFILDTEIKDPESSDSILELVGGTKGDEVLVPWINFKSLSEYYTICMAFGLVDSVQKNMNLKSWNSDPTTKKGTFYAAFYDMDTCLGINNAGEDTTYFAFSDYWSYSEENFGGVVIPSSVTIYRDYSPKANKSEGESDFYDTASSYLFAVAKYVKYLDVSKNCEDIVTMWPKELWAKWRGSATDPLDPGKGCLRSAKYFIDNYFGNNLGSVPQPLINSNYRNKYLVMIGENKTAFNDNNFKKFNGTRVAKAEDWLDGRFHILDAYFNLSNSESSFKYYKKTKVSDNLTYETYENIKRGANDIWNDLGYSGNYNLDSNEDVKILRDIFSGKGSNQSSGTININVKSKEYSPIIVDFANSPSKRFLLGGDNLYNIIVSLNGMQTYKFLGSSAWTYLDSINTFGFSNLNIESDFLEKLEGTSGKMTVNHDDTKGIKAITMPSLKDLILTSPSYSGTLEIKGTSFPNLNTIDISRSQINLSISESNLTRIKATGVEANSLSIINCKSINNVSIDNVVLKKCDIRPVPSYLIQASGLENPRSWGSGGLVFNYTDASKGIEDLTLQNVKPTGGNSRVHIKGDNKLVNLDISGFSCVVIESCPNLERIIIKDPVTLSDGTLEGDKLTRICVTGCGSSKSGFRIGNDNTPGRVAELGGFTDLAFVRLDHLPNLETIKLNNTDPNRETYLDTEAFGYNSGLKYLVGEGLVITGPRTFCQCPLFTLRTDSRENTAPGLRVDVGVTDLSGTFQNGNTGIRGNITLPKAKGFIESLPKANRITNISNIFHGQPIEYTESDLVYDLTHTTGKRGIDMSVLKYVTNVSGAFSWTGISAWSREWHSFGSAVNEIESFENYILKPGGSDFVISTTYDAYYDIIDKVSVVSGSVDNGSGGCSLKFLNSSGSRIVNPTVRNFFHPTVRGVQKHPTRCKVLKLIDFYGSADLTGLFKDWRGLEEIQNSLRNNRDREDGTLTGLNNLLNPEPTTANSLPNLRSVHNSFVFPNHKLSLMEFAEWNTLASKSINPFRSYADNSTSITGMRESFSAKKYITLSNFQILLRILVNRERSNLTGIDNIFRDTTVILGNGAVAELSLVGTLSNTIVSANATFRNFSMVQNTIGDETDPTNLNKILLGERDYVILNERIFESLPKIRSLAYCFSEMKIANSIPYNFFRKRYTKVVSDKYFIRSSTVTEDLSKYRVSEYGDGFRPAKLFTYEYQTGDTAITSLYRCFMNVKWAKEARSFIPDDTIERSYLVDTVEGKIISASSRPTYYERKDNLVYQTVYNQDGTRVDLTDNFYVPAGILEEPTEYSDTQDLHGYHINSFNLGDSIIFKNATVQEGSQDKLFIAPDILYGITPGCAIQDMFSNSGSEVLEGIIPEHLLKNTQSNFSGMMYGLNIIPRYYGEYSVEKTVADVTTRTTNKVYYYVPFGFTKSTDLTGCFNFNINLPSPGNQSTDGNAEYNYFYLFLCNESDKSGSIPTTVTFLKDALPNRKGLNDWNTGGGGPNFYTSNFDIKYGLMFSPTYSNDADGTLKFIGGTEGIRMDIYKSLLVDKLIGGNLSFVLSGNLFHSTTLNTLRKSSDNYFMTAFGGYSDSTSYVSRSIVFPPATGNFYGRKLIEFNRAQLHIRESQVEGGTASCDAYETIIMGNDNTHKITIDKNT